MKKIILTSIILNGFHPINAQTNRPDTLTKNELIKAFSEVTEDYKRLKRTIYEIDSCQYNHEKYVFSELINENSFVSFTTRLKNYDFQLLSAIGNRNEQSVTINILVINQGLNQKVYIDQFGGAAIDGIGNSGELSKIKIGSESHFGTIYTNVPVQLQLTFNSVMPGTEKFNLVAFKMNSVNIDSKTTSNKELLEIRDIQINW